MRAFFVVTSLVAVSAFGYVAGCTSNIKPPIDEDDYPETLTPYVPPVTATGGEDAGTDASFDAAATCTTAAANSCNQLGLCVSKIYVVGSTQSTPPAAVGGSIVSGTYNLVDVTAYGISAIPAGTSTTYWFQQTFTLSAATIEDGGADDAEAGAAGPTFQEATTSYNGGGVGNINGTITITPPSTYSFSYTCGDQSPTITGSYSASANSFVFSIPQPMGGTLVETLSR